MRLRPIRALALLVTAIVVAGAPASFAGVKPSLTLARGGALTTSGTIQGMDEGHYYTPPECAANPLPSSPCDVIPVKLGYPATFPPDFKFSVTATLTFDQIAPPMSMQVCLFRRGTNDGLACAGGSTVFGKTLVTTISLDAATRDIDAVVDQRIGYNTKYTLTLKWADLNTPSKLTATSTKTGSTSTLTGKLVDEKGKGIAGQPLIWRSGSKTLATTKTDSTGTAKLLKVARGQKITVTYGGSSKYTGASATLTS